MLQYFLPYTTWSYLLNILFNNSVKVVVIHSFHSHKVLHMTSEWYNCWNSTELLTPWPNCIGTSAGLETIGTRRSLLRMLYSPVSGSGVRRQRHLVWGAVSAAALCRVLPTDGGQPQADGSHGSSVTAVRTSGYQLIDDSQLLSLLLLTAVMVMIISTTNSSSPPCYYPIMQHFFKTNLK